MQCPRCGSNVFYLDIKLSLVVKDDVAYINDVIDYISATCARCGEWEINEGEVFETVNVIKFDYDKMREILDEAKKAKENKINMKRQIKKAPAKGTEKNLNSSIAHFSKNEKGDKNGIYKYSFIQL